MEVTAPAMLRRGEELVVRLVWPLVELLGRHRHDAGGGVAPGRRGPLHCGTKALLVARC